MCAEQFCSRCLIAMAPFVSRFTFSQLPADANWVSSIVELLAAVWYDRDAQRIMFCAGNSELSADWPPAGAPPAESAPRVESLDSQHAEQGNTTAERPASRHVRLEYLRSKLGHLTLTLAELIWDKRYQLAQPLSAAGTAATTVEYAALATAAMSAVTQRAAAAFEESLRLHNAVAIELRASGRVPTSNRWIQETLSILATGLCPALSIMQREFTRDAGRHLVARTCCALSSIAAAAEAAAAMVDQKWVNAYVDNVRVVIDCSMTLSSPVPRCAFVHVPFVMHLVHGPRPRTAVSPCVQ